MKYMVKSKILATFCAGLLTVSTGIQAAERLATGTFIPATIAKATLS